MDKKREFSETLEHATIGMQAALLLLEVHKLLRDLEVPKASLYERKFTADKIAALFLKHFGEPPRFTFESEINLEGKLKEVPFSSFKTIAEKHGFTKDFHFYEERPFTFEFFAVSEDREQAIMVRYFLLHDNLVVGAIASASPIEQENKEVIKELLALFPEVKESS